MMLNTRFFAFAGLLAFVFAASGCGGAGIPYSPIITGTNQTGSTGDFSIAPKSQTVQTFEFGQFAAARPGNSVINLASFNISLTSLNGFAGQVNLAVSNTSNLSTPAATTFNTSIPASVTLEAGRTAPVTLQIQAKTLVPVQNYTFTVTATSGSLSHAATCVLQVENANFQLTPGTQSKTYTDQNGPPPTFVFTIDATSLGSFTGDVNLQVISPTNSGSSDFTPALPAKVTISKLGGSQSFDLTVSTDDPTLDPGSYTFTAEGSSHGQTRSCQCVVNVLPQTDTSARKSN